MQNNFCLLVLLYFQNIICIFYIHGLAVRRPIMAMRVPNGTICKIVIYKINCTAVYIMFAAFVYIFKERI